MDRRTDEAKSLEVGMTENEWKYYAPPLSSIELSKNIVGVKVSLKKSTSREYLNLCKQVI